MMVPVIMVLGAGIALGQSAAVVRGLRQQATPFRRTPKYRLGQRHDRSWRLAAYRVSASRIALGECLAGTLVFGVACIQVLTGVAVPTGMAILVGAGSLAVGTGILLQHQGPLGRDYTRSRASAA